MKTFNPIYHYDYIKDGSLTSYIVRIWKKRRPTRNKGLYGFTPRSVRSGFCVAAWRIPVRSYGQSRIVLSGLTGNRICQSGSSGVYSYATPVLSLYGVPSVRSHIQDYTSARTSQCVPGRAWRRFCLRP